jgi:hypothetical protein
MADKKRRRSESPHVRRCRIQGAAGPILRCLERRLEITAPYSGRKLTQEQYSTARRVCYLEEPEIGLFKMYDPLTSQTLFSWERCQFALARKATIECSHREGCTGFAGDGRSLMGRLLRLCNCPDKVIVNSYLWLVDPKDKEVKFRSEGVEYTVVHGKEHVQQ